MAQIVILTCLAVIAAAIGQAFRTYARLVQKYSDGAPRSSIDQARGFAEISGVARAPEGAPTTNPVTGSSCVWYRVVFERDDTLDRVDSEHVSRDAVLLDDGTGTCAVAIEKLKG